MYKRYNKIIFSCFLVFLFSCLLVLAAEPPAAPAVSFAGDDLLQNGGADDAYDALIAIDIIASQTNPAAWSLEYSADGGQNWSSFAANYSAVANNHRIYYWSTSKIYAPNLLVRTRTEQGGTWSEYYQVSLSLTHRSTNHEAHYFVESFNDSAYKDPSTTADWDTANALVELPPNPPNYHPNGQANSTNLLAGVANNNVTGVTLQPVQWPFGETLEYQVSNNGADWYGDTSGISRDNVWFSFAGQIVPAAVYVPFADSAGDGLYWRARLKSNISSISPQIYQLRLTWEENTAPQACFTVNPSGSQDPGEVYNFNGNCSADYEDDLSQLDFRWDWQNDGIFDTSWQTGYAGYVQTHIFNSTSTFTINMEARDTQEAVDAYLNSVNEEGVEGSVAGWAWSSNYGWISLNCENTYYESQLSLCPPNYGWQMNADLTMTGWAWDANLGWLCLGSTCNPYGVDPLQGRPPTATYSRATGEVNGWGKFLNFDESGWLLLRGDWCGTAEDQCVNLNFSRRSIEGYAWAGGDIGGVNVGPGWVTFQGNINVPWLETKYGSIYGRGNLGSSETAQPPDSRYTASYCILASGNIINFSSAIGCAESAYRDLNFPNISERYRTILGIIDFEEIINGNEVEYTSADVDASLPSVLAGEVYHFVGQENYIIDQPLVFYNARNLNSSGAGTIVVDGNLYINSNIYYESAPVSSQIENLASAAWIVKGDVIINLLVSKIESNIIVLGEAGVACPNEACGNFKTGDDSSNPRQLVIDGLVMAKQFDLQRYYKTAGEASEVIIYDGRVLINTPPGLANVAKGLPVWREAFATTEIE